MKLACLHIWQDPIAREGPESMAVDEYLLESIKSPILRVYRWSGDWGSLGYFGNLTDAVACYTALKWVRRWTGGGVVDHRTDWTYSLIIPNHEPLASKRGRGSYHFIHHCLAETLRAEGRKCLLSSGEEASLDHCCFKNPVEDDLLDISRNKIAGAGQRRSRMGLLHQGSVSLKLNQESSSLLRARFFASQLASSVELLQNFDIDRHRVSHLKEIRYECDDWTARR